VKSYDCLSTLISYLLPLTSYLCSYLCYLCLGLYLGLFVPLSSSSFRSMLPRDTSMHALLATKHYLSIALLLALLVYC